MRERLLILLPVFFVLGLSLAAQPNFLQPQNTVDLEAAFGINVSVVSGASTYTIEIGLDGIFSGLSPDYQIQTSSSRYFYVGGLTYGANYTLRASSDAAPGVFNTMDVSIKPAPLTNVTNVTNGETITTNKRLFTTAQHITTTYEWEFNTQSDFSGTGVDQFLASTSVNNYFLQPGLLQTGAVYYVRTRAIIGSQGLTGPWTDEWDAGSVVNFNTGAPEVTFFQPSSPTDVEATFDIIVAPLAGASTYTIELGLDGIFSGSFPDYQEQTGSIRSFEVSNLTYGANYTIRVTTDNGGLGTLDINVKSEPLTFVNNVTNGTTLPLSGIRFITEHQNLTTTYDWEFNTQSDFSGTGQDQFLVSTTANDYLVLPANLQPETQYYVRTRSIIGSQSLTGPWTDEWDAGSVVNFFTPALGIAFIEPTFFMDQEATFLISVNVVPGASQYTLEIGKDSVFSGSSPDYQTKTSSSRFLTVTGLDYGGTYFIRATADVLAGAWITEEVTIKPLPETNVTNIADGTYFNDFTVVNFITRSQHLTTTYDWEFNTQPDFSGTGADQFTASTATNDLDLDLNDLQPGTQYYVRTRSNIGSQGLTGMWSDELDPDQSISIFTPLGLNSVFAPLADDTLDATTFQAWVEPVNGATGYTFQISTDENFNTILEEQNANGFISRYTGEIVDSIFTPSEIDPELEVDFWAYRYFGNENVLGLERGTNYYLRVKAFNENQSGNFGPISRINTGFPSSYVIIPANGQSEVDINGLVRFKIVVSAESYDLQINTENSFDTPQMQFNDLVNYRYFFDTLLYNTTYYSRIRIDDDPWGDSIVSWTTKVAPTTSIIHPNEGQTIAPNTQFITSQQGKSVYEWEIDTQIDFSSGNKLTVTSNKPKVQFIDMLDYSTNYYVRVRAIVPSQSITGPWSTTVMFATSAIPPEFNSDISNQSSLAQSKELDTIILDKIFPNPFTTSFKVSLQSDNPRLDLLLYDSYGGVVFFIKNQSINQLNQSQFGEDLLPGMYLLRIVEAGNPVGKSLRIIKQ